MPLTLMSTEEFMSASFCEVVTSIANYFCGVNFYTLLGSGLEYYKIFLTNWFKSIFMHVDKIVMQASVNFR